MKFRSQSEAEAFKANRGDLLEGLHKEVMSFENIEYSEVWLCGHCESFVAGFNSEDQHIVSLKIE